MENKMFFENEKKIVELVTPLSEEQFDMLYRLLCRRSWGLELDSNPSIIDANTIGETIKIIRDRIPDLRSESGLRSELGFDITDEELTFLITRYGYLERTVTISGEVYGHFHEDINVPLDADLEELTNPQSLYLYVYDDDVEVRDKDVTDVRCSRIVTTMKFNLPTPTTFGFTDEMKEVA